jgi:hypothetical protein
MTKYFRLNILPSLSLLFNYKYVLIVHTMVWENSNYHPFSPGITHAPPQSFIIGDQKSPRFFPSHRLVQTLKTLGKRKTLSLLLPHTWPIMAVCNFPPNF